MKIFGITRIRNEAEIIRDTLDHWGTVCNGGIFVYDDMSTDGTAALCRQHPRVREVVEGQVWHAERPWAESLERQAVLERAQQAAGPGDWFAYFDADERLYLKDRLLFFEPEVKSIACRLFDVYITPEDVQAPYAERRWVGPEYRDIIFFFKNSPALRYDQGPIQREVTLEPGGLIGHGGVIKHFGKGISVQQWEDTCDYYIANFPPYAEKWRQRKGRAVHDYVSDFGRPLVKFSDILTGVAEGVSLGDQTMGRLDRVP